MSIMADSGQEFSGRTVDEAIAEGLAKLGIRNDQAEIEILNRGSRGIFGLGSEPARVRISRRASSTPPQAPRPAPPPTPAPLPSRPQTPAKPEAAPEANVTPLPPQTAPRPSVTPETSTPESVTQIPPLAQPPAEEKRPRLSNLMDDEHEEYEEHAGDEHGDEHAEAVSDEELTAMAMDLLSQLVKNMGFDAQISADWHDADDNGERYLLLDIQGHDVSALIGRRGETLASIQYLVRLMINQRIKRWKNIVVDVEQYKERRVNQLTQLAKRMADQVAQSGRAVSLEPMPANERRIVHLALRDHPTVYTQSSGEGERRKVHIVSRS
jgi:spoIIIJ-associated protein